jgi:hypothetical protein
MRLASLVLTVFVTGCAVSPADVDGETDDVLIDDGKSDNGGILEGSPEATLLLAYANRFPVQWFVDHVGIAPITAKSIVAYRAKGPGPLDDEYFETLAELDRVPYVGPIAFERFLEFGRLSVGPERSDAWVPDEPYEWAECWGIDDRQLAALVPPGTSVARPFSWHLASRHRTCPDYPSDCSDFVDGPLSLKTDQTPAIYPVPTTGTIELARTAGGDFVMYLDSPNSPIGFQCIESESTVFNARHCTPTLNRDASVPLVPPTGRQVGFTQATGNICYDGRFQFRTHNWEHDFAIWGWL